ncbi:hypothetical protein BGW38_009553 [Lunasporangiospora selenospora]|uniref:ARM repeat-containing protein n=1 Tax=Lunasporangiospora selenospora TaxID=979761 RepID=A0A9P6FZ62_9FUNG|nr:hypothetical protein BGW38_009553 [Lunasporangiospora selenospora]
MEKLGLDKDKRAVDSLPSIGTRVGSDRSESAGSPSESSLVDNTHLSKYTEKIIFEDDNDTTPTSSSVTTSSRLSSLQMNRVLHDDGIWKDQQGLGSGASYLQRILQMGSQKDAFSPLLTTPSTSSALDLAKSSHSSGLRMPGGQESGHTSEWPQYNKSFSERIPMPQRTNSLVGYGLTTSNSGTDDSIKSVLPKLTPSYSTSEIPTRYNKAGSLSAFEDAVDVDQQPQHRQGLGLKSDLGSTEVCLQFQQHGYCPRELCPYLHTLVLPSTSRPSSGIPLSPGLSLTVGAIANGSNSASLYSRVNSNMGSTNSLMNGGSFPFSMAPNGFASPATTSSANLLRMPQSQSQPQSQHQHQPTPHQTSNSVTLANKANQKRPSADVEANRFAGASLEGFVGQIYSLCKDQHGCRYLQKKLEEQNEKYLSIIFGEVFGHFVELMTDPFGNYLCQKLLEFCGDDQRTVIVETVAPELVNISLNMHGTRAVQKMIEFLSTSQQIAIVVMALNPSVVTLIKDLNGNHVIQKCLNRFASEDNQFIYNAISTHCIEVATHRHGCCVLQRCIDHASVSQKIQLVREITFNALTLVQDPYGNYVVQYVLDLDDNRFTDNLIRRFIGNVCALSVQKFSSNVIEKCIRVSEPETRKFLIEEMINKTRLDKLLRDSYANYVVQTSLDAADPIQRAQLVECIRPLLPAIRNTPYGKRIQGKLHRDQLTGNGNGSINGGVSVGNGGNGSINGGNGGGNGSGSNHGHGSGNGNAMGHHHPHHSHHGHNHHHHHLGMSGAGNNNMVTAATAAQMNNLAMMNGMSGSPMGMNGLMNGMHSNMNMHSMNNMGNSGNMGNMNTMSPMSTMSTMNTMSTMSNLNGMTSMTHSSHANHSMGMGVNGHPIHNMATMNGMGATMSGSSMGAGSPGATPNMSGMASTGSANTMTNGLSTGSNSNMMGFGFPSNGSSGGAMNHYGNVGMVGMNDYNPYGYM